ncbi:MAG: ABC transporter ATP-binding protein [Candidatus Omnitrophica bacterium]|nr:ABC transporter ATP-binding protein [Candidatus Omnitrophota bacterium]
MQPILEVKNLKTEFFTEVGVARAVEGVSFNVTKGETLALVGESGCGKTVTALSIMRLVPSPPGKIVAGEIFFKGEDLLGLPASKMRTIRGRHIGMIFQEPMSSLNPLYTIGYQIKEALLAHKRAKGRQARERAIQLLSRVEMPDPKQRFKDYPHSLSGGLRQRAMIAQAIACNPELVIADEPTTALDVTIQAEILELFFHLKKTTETSFLLITHDLGVVAEVADRVCVMYAGRIVEEADVFTLFSRPRHPYTLGLLNSIPARRQPRQKFAAIPGVVPDPKNKPSGCAFHPRCNMADSGCQIGVPALIEVEEGHKVRCFKHKKLADTNDS